MSDRIARLIAHRAVSAAALITLAAVGAAGTAGTAGAQDTAAPARRLSGFVGAAVVSLPQYAGSDEYRMLPVPIGQLEYRGRFYLGGGQAGPGVGAHLVRTPSFTWDAGFTGAGPRRESRGDALAGMGNRSGASFATTGVAYRLVVVQASASAAVGLGKEQGSYGTVGLGTELPLARRILLGVSTGATFANARHMEYEFGVTSEQSAKRRALLAAGDARLDGIDVGAYAPRAGLKQTSGGASVSYLLTPRSRLVLFTQSSTLSGEARRSPIVRKRSGAMSGLALGYGF